MNPQRHTTGPLPTEPQNLGQLETRASSPRSATEPNVFAQLDHPPIVSIDGGAGSGKSSVAKLVAEIIGGAPILDSGRWFRALGFIALRNNIDPENTEQIEALGTRFSFSGAPKDSPHEIIAKELIAHDSISSGISTDELETQAVADAASKIGKHQGLRRIFQSRQLEEALQGCITVGRAQGSEVFTPEFSELTGQPVLRILLHADLETRASRRFLQQNGREPTEKELKNITGDLRTRDTRDMTRDVAPLMSPDQALAKGYVVIDTSAISSSDVAEQIVSHIRKLVPNLSTGGSI